MSQITMGDLRRSYYPLADSTATPSALPTQLPAGGAEVTPKSSLEASTAPLLRLTDKAAGGDGNEISFSFGVAPDPTRPNAKIYNIGPCIPGDKPVVRAIYQALSVASPAVGFYHGYKKNGGSIGYGLWWGLMGMVFPVIAPTIAIADGLGQSKES